MDNTAIINDALESFRIHFPIPIRRVIAYGEEMRYILGNREIADLCNVEAQIVIINNHLPLEAFIEIWSCGGFIREIAMVVKFVPEQYHIQAY